MALAPRWVLVVDDDRAIRESTAWMLGDAGYMIREAADGRSALHILRASDVPFVVLLDYRMPGMDGHAVLLVVDADPELAAHHAFVLVTAERATISPDVECLLDQLDIPIVEKPFDMDQLLDVVDHAARRLLWIPPDPSISGSWVGI